MARGHQKFQSQQKNAKKQAEIKKSKGHDQKAAAKAALVYTCTVCRVCKSVENTIILNISNGNVTRAACLCAL
uniref:Small EDRK-rich factor-like N-terminal domain-containing protein n=1 Tax=Fundulus heteroclitus TaxID=8078 RepID=A0A3Q2PUA3_FUNHE